MDLEAAMGMNEVMMQFAEVAKGFKSSLISEGWSESVSDKVAGEYLTNFINFTWANMIADISKKNAVVK